MSPDTPLCPSISVPSSYQDRRDAFTARGELSWSFAAQRWRHGLAVGAGAVLQLALALFLLSQIKTSPGLKTQLAAMGFIFCFCGATCLVSSIRDLFGRLVVDDKGISVHPSIAGFSMTWEQIIRCEVKDAQSNCADSPFILLWGLGSDDLWCVPGGWLSHANRVQVQRVLEDGVLGRTMFGA